MELPGELADLLEVRQAMAMSADLVWEGVLEVRRVKRYERRGFEDRVRLEGLAQLVTAFSR